MSKKLVAKPKKEDTNKTKDIKVRSNSGGESEIDFTTKSKKSPKNLLRIKTGLSPVTP